MSTPVLSLPLHESAHVALTPNPPTVTASIVQSATGTATAGTTVTVTLPGNTTAGNCLVAYIGSFQTTTDPTVSGITLGGAAGNWASAESLNVNTVANAEIWVDWNCAGGQTSIVVTFTAGTGSSQCNAVRVEEWSLVQNVSTPVDQISGHATLNTTFTSNATPTLSNANELLVGCVFAGSTPTGPASPWTNPAAVPVATFFLQTGWQIVTATTGQAYAGGLSANAVFSAVIASLKLQTVAPGPPGGAGTIRISPGQPAAPGSGVGASRNSGLQWDVSGIAVSVATNVKEATAAAYISYGIQSATPEDFQGQTQTGSTGDTCTVNATLRPGDWITVIWSGGDAGAIATARIFGTITPPGVS